MLESLVVGFSPAKVAWRIYGWWAGYGPQFTEPVATFQSFFLLLFDFALGSVRECVACRTHLKDPGSPQPVTFPGEMWRAERGVMCQSWLQIWRVNLSSSLVAEKPNWYSVSWICMFTQEPWIGRLILRWHKAQSLSLLGSLSAYSQTFWLKLGKNSCKYPWVLVFMLISTFHIWACFRLKILLF